MLSQHLTQKQQKVLKIIKNLIKIHKQPPTILEICEAYGGKAKSTIAQYIKALEKKGYIRRIPGAYRGIILNTANEGFLEIPLKGIVAAGKPIEEIEENDTVKVPKRLIPHLNNPYFALKVQGESMIEDGIYDGEIVIVESKNYADNGDLVIAKDTNGNVTLKYFYRENNRIRLEPRNSKMSPIYLDNCEIIGIFRGITPRI